MTRLAIIAIVVIIAIIVWGVIKLSKARSGTITGENGNETYIERTGSAEDAARYQADAQEARREIVSLRERIQVLERIATDDNSTDALARAQISAEIEALRTTADAPPKAISASETPASETPASETPTSETEKSPTSGTEDPSK
jgi:FtsZ-interacting cell division protein ZipA